MGSEPDLKTAEKLTLKESDEKHRSNETDELARAIRKLRTRNLGQMYLFEVLNQGLPSGRTAVWRSSLPSE
jgi:hypothetical protein